MRCDQITPYLPGYAGGDLRPDTARIVAKHVAGCRSCTADLARLERVQTGLSVIAEGEIVPPAYLVDAILEQTAEHPRRRLLAPMLPLPVEEVARVVADHREAIASAAGTALVAAGAAYALWRVVRGSRAAQPATS
jgi:anti-sigma factor RsiW